MELLDSNGRREPLVARHYQLGGLAGLPGGGQRHSLPPGHLLAGDELDLLLDLELLPEALPVGDGRGGLVILPGNLKIFQFHFQGYMS